MKVADNKDIPLPGSVEIQPEFWLVIEDVVSRLTLSFHEIIHSIYVYGSVAEGRAKTGKSDLDMTIIFRQKLAQTTTEQLAKIHAELERNNSTVSKIDFDCGFLEEVLSQDNILSWGYWLKHHCRCVYGEDLSQYFQPFKPSRAIAVAVNGDFQQVLSRLITQMKMSSDVIKKQQLLCSAARKLIRSTNILRNEQDDEWPDSLNEHRNWFIARYPSLEKDIDDLMAIGTGGRGNLNDYEKRLITFASWLNAEFLRY
ncbi:nucleotidyltransferase [Pectobacterium brasiliense]|uniref:nucleotidyltransferase domain-containing protein n=1 Tax=Pectobacterium brasiliense TaxID=180957 RepID=UPI0001A427DB|nr:nucleotidyltransferase domain-containing protein [Pectobacterium brasiliense]KGA21922.1 nucleotidyltransferase [Pectobacterium brasiliense]KRF63649.1 nucleotidyltransferase [Pectobacterium brasiliense]MBN3187276.1 nucleotidyltransferase domain-containing protein [Pectobacterium brasiliense]QHG29263.1 nucleotidyltransferase domain-containing protein [Pectobacterium brasiliense]